MLGTASRAHAPANANIAKTLVLVPMPCLPWNPPISSLNTAWPRE